MRADAMAEVVVRTIKAALAPVIADIGTLRTRIAAVEVHVPIVGPQGEKGERGERGTDGFGFDDLQVQFDGLRTLRLTFVRETTRKDFDVQLPIPIYRGVFDYGNDYAIGDVITHDGSAWHCQVATKLPPRSGSGEWRLMVKHGKNGKDAPALEGVR